MTDTPTTLNGTSWRPLLLPLPPILVGVGLILTGNPIAQALGVACILGGLYVPIYQYRAAVNRAKRHRAATRADEARQRDAEEARPATEPAETQPQGTGTDAGPIRQST